MVVGYPDGPAEATAITDDEIHHYEARVNDGIDAR